ILGTSLNAIDRAEDRNQFEGLLEELDLSRPKGKAVSDKSLVIPTAKEIGYPVLVRPSYVIGGSQMEIVHDEEELTRYLNKTPVTSLNAIDRAEDRNQFEGLLEELDLSRPKGKAVSDKSLVIPTAKEIGYPVLVRPSYVIGGSQMEIVHDEEELTRYLNKTPV